ncbi:DNA polymerase III subunit gamma/tau [Candidatus Dependentiae bacterium]
MRENNQMSAEKMNLNLTRKWRSKSFEQIVGQELSVRMLKNSLYLNQFFPVYLFSGQRGCGKTSTARVFASAINCANLSKFQKNPKACSVPCLECASCKSMLTGNHPDFIEIDAASHTGVDNVRQIIESSSFMPLMGNKKIYLIDEAHMLSKAAFNAFLKILEEPPSSVLFVLATTNPQKIIETVRSRCFQLFFKSVAHDALVKHLKHVSKEEKISHDSTGLGIIAAEAQGSVRDSLNILEQVRFSSGAVTKNSVQNVLGHIDDESLLQLFERLITCGPQEVLQYLKDLKYDTFSPQYLWKKIIDITRAAIWVKHGVLPNSWQQYLQKIHKLVEKTSWARLHYIMQLFYENESVFIKTTEKHSLLEMILIQMAKKNDVSNKSGASSAPNKAMPSEDEDVQEEYVEIEEEEALRQDERVSGSMEKTGGSLVDSVVSSGANKAASNAGDSTVVSVKSQDGNSNWDLFLSSLVKLEDPLLSSIFRNGEVLKFDSACGDLEVTFSKQFSFFKDSLKETERLWLPILQQAYARDINFKPLFTGDALGKVSKYSSNKRIEKPKNQVGQNSTSNVTRNGAGSYPQDYASFKKSNARSYKPASSGRNKTNRAYNRSAGASGSLNSGKLIDVSDVSSWKKANTLLKYFSGTVREVQEN